MWFAHILCFAFWKPFGTCFGVHFGSFWEAFGTLGAPWGLQEALQGSSKEARELLEPLEKTGWKRDDFGGLRGGALEQG